MNLYICFFSKAKYKFVNGIAAGFSIGILLCWYVKPATLPPWTDTITIETYNR